MVDFYCLLVWLASTRLLDARRGRLPIWVGRRSGPSILAAKSLQFDSFPFDDQHHSCW